MLFSNVCHCITALMLVQKLCSRNSAFERFISFLRRRPIIPWVNLRYIWDIRFMKCRFSFQRLERVLSKFWYRFLSFTLQNLWQKFIEGKLLLTDFVESLQSSRVLCHRRLFQVEKIHNLIIHAQIYNQDADFSHFEHHPNFLHSPTTINVFSGTAPVILLPGFHYPHLSPISHLPPLKHIGCVDTCSTLISKNESSTETRRWPQRHAALQPLEKIQPNIYQTPK